MQEHIFIVRLHFLFWKMFSLWRDPNESRAYKLYRIIMNIFFFLLYMGSIVIGAVTSDTVEDFFTQTLYTALTEMAMSTKVIVAFLNFSSIVRLHQTVLCAEFQPVNEAEEKHSRNYLKRFNFIYCGYLLWVMCSVLSNITYLFNAQYRLPMFPWLLGIPYGPDHPNNYMFVCIYQITGMFIHAIINLAVDTQIGYLLAVAGIQMDFLAGRLGTGQPSQIDSRMEYKKSFKQHVNHFNKVIEYIEDVERLYSIPVFSQFCASGITICAIAYRLSSVNFAEDFVAAVPMSLYLFSMMIQIFFPCYLGNELTLKSEHLRYAMYSSEWYRMNLQDQKLVQMLMVRLVRPTTVKAGGYFIYNLGSFSSTLNTAYSLFCVLQRRAQKGR